MKIYPIFLFYLRYSFGLKVYIPHDYDIIIVLRQYLLFNSRNKHFIGHTLYISTKRSHLPEYTVVRTQRWANARGERVGRVVLAADPASLTTEASAARMMRRGDRSGITCDGLSDPLDLAADRILAYSIE